MDPKAGSPTAIARLFDEPLQPGEWAFLRAPPGAGKSAFFVQVGLEALLSGRRVLHLSLDAAVDRVHAHYDTLLADMEERLGLNDGGATRLRVERLRMIQAWPDGRFSVQRLQGSLEWLAEHMGFRPAVIIVDGLGDRARENQAFLGSAGPMPEGLSETEAKAFVHCLRSTSAHGWLGARTALVGLERAMADAATASFSIRTTGTTRELVAHSVRGLQGPTVSLHPETSRVLDPPANAVDVDRPAILAADCTLYSGAAAGAEALFGECAERAAIREVNFSFSGHAAARERGLLLLGDTELRRGDVSLAYVSRRMNRTYTSSPAFRRVLQCIWHMVDNAEQVFVLGAIQEDGTVRGGTGWGAELARLSNKPLFVYDQDQHHWFKWSGSEQRWLRIPPPLITSANHCGTGTRFVTDEGRAAIESLYARSFVTG